MPLFIYPLGLSCILLLVALWFCFKRSRWTFIPVLLAFIILMTASNNQFSNSFVASVERQYLPLKNTPKAEAIVVLGGATKNNEPPRIIADLSDRGDRLLYAVKLYKDGAAPYIILSGGRIEWYGTNSSEAENMAVLMEIMGVPRNALLLEPRSINTYENAVYTKEILDRRSIDQIILVTSAFHMPRSLAIFKKQGIDAIPAPTDFMISDRNLRENEISTESRIIGFFPNPECLENTTIILKEYIGTFIYRLKGWL